MQSLSGITFGMRKQNATAMHTSSGMRRRILHVERTKSPETRLASDRFCPFIVHDQKEKKRGAHIFFVPCRKLHLEVCLLKISHAFNHIISKRFLFLWYSLRENLIISDAIFANIHFLAYSEDRIPYVKVLRRWRVSLLFRISTSTSRRVTLYACRSTVHKFVNKDYGLYEHKLISPASLSAVSDRSQNLRSDFINREWSVCDYFSWGYLSKFVIPYFPHET